jgi:dihydrofolate synthase/folylpolyglutamate synthase
MGTGATGLGRRTRRAADDDETEGPSVRPVVFAGFAEALDYLNRAPSVERVRPKDVSPDAFSLDRMRALMDALGNPEREVRFVHIAGSKGKGSVCEMLTACLTECGCTTGLYTSPHLVDVRERIRINAAMVSEQEFSRGLGRVATAASAIRERHGEATYFELTTALAFQHFRDMAVDIAVVEVGLGGRLDSTNVITPEVCGIVAIQLEHTQLLGDTLEKIAAEKAGIFKQGVPAITVPQTPGVLGVFRERAAAAGAALSVLKEDIDFSYRVEAGQGMGPHVRVSLTTPQSSYEHLPAPLKGEHQAFNCGLVLAILDRLRTRGFDANEVKVAEGLKKTRSDGRMEMICTSPRILIDGAHNPESIQALVRAIGGHVRYDSMVMVFGCASDKDVAGMLEKVSLGADKVIFTRAEGNPRAMQARELHRRFVESSGKMAEHADTVQEALRLAARAVGRDDLIVVTGSFHLAGEAKRFIRELEARRAAAAR